MALSQKGVDVRQTGTSIQFRAFLQTSAGALLGTGTTVLSLIELQSDGTIKSFDFSDFTFKTTGLTTATLAMTHRPANNAATTTGLWTVSLGTVSGFTNGGIYFAIVNNTGAAPTDQMREFQYGGDQGDLLVTAGSTGQAYLQGDNQKWLGGTIPAVNVTGVPKVDVLDWLGSTPDALSSGKVPADLKLWLTVAPLALSSQLVQAIVNDYASGKVPLQPTVAGRTLDVSATGEGGVDWANVGSPTTTVGLSGTTIKAVTDAVSVGSITGDVAGKVLGGGVSVITGDGVKAASVTGNVTGSVGSLATQAKADVNAEVVDALNVDTYPEPGQGAPPATLSIVGRLQYLYKFMRNRVTQTATTFSVFADDTTTVDQKAAVSDDLVTFDRGEIGSGP